MAGMQIFSLATVKCNNTLEEQLFIIKLQLGSNDEQNHIPT